MTQTWAACPSPPPPSAVSIEEEAEEEEEGVFEEKAGAQIFVDVLCLIRICARAARAFTHGCFTN